MFRKAYKDAISDIETNKELLNSLLIKAHSEGIPKKRKKPIIYTIAPLAAAAVIAIFSIKTFDTRELIKNSENNQVVSEKNEEIILLPEKEEAKEETENVKNFAVKETIPHKEVKKTEGTQESTFDKNETVPQAAEDVQTNAVADEIITDSNEAEIENEENPVEMRAYSGGGGGGSSAHTTSETTVKTEIWSVAEYSEYLGIDVEKKAVIPEDMKKTSEDTVYISKDYQSGEIVNDYHTITYSGEEGRYISVTTTKETTNFDASQDIKDGEFQTASFINSNVAFRIECYKLTEEEKNILLKSLSK